MRFTFLLILMVIATSFVATDFYPSADNNSSTPEKPSENLKADQLTLFLKHRVYETYQSNKVIGDRLKKRIADKNTKDDRRKDYKTILQNAQKNMKGTAEIYQSISKRKVGLNEAEGIMKKLMSLFLSMDDLVLLFGVSAEGIDLDDKYPDLIPLPVYRSCYYVGEDFYDDCICAVNVDSKCSRFEEIGMDVTSFEQYGAFNCFLGAMNQQDDCMNTHHAGGIYSPPSMTACTQAETNCFKPEYPPEPPAIPLHPFADLY